MPAIMVCQTLVHTPCLIPIKAHHLLRFVLPQNVARGLDVLSTTVR